MKNKRDFTITIKPSKRTGHVPKRSGAGAHEDKRSKRCRTREEQNKKAVQEEADSNH